MHFLSHLYVKNLRSLVGGDIVAWPNEKKQYLKLVDDEKGGGSIGITEAINVLADFVELEEKEALIELFTDENQQLYRIRNVPKKQSRTRYHARSKKRAVVTTRCIEKPAEVLLAAQRKILRWLEGIYQPPKSVYGFVKTRNHISNAQFHADDKPKYVFSIDIEDFFGTTTIVQLYPKLMDLFGGIDLKGHPIDKVVESVLLLCTNERSWPMVSRYTKPPHLKELTLLMKQIRYFNKLFSHTQGASFKGLSVSVEGATVVPYVWPHDFTMAGYGEMIQKEGDKFIAHSKQLKRRSKLYAKLLTKLHPKAATHALEIERLLKWKYGFPMPTSFKQSTISSIIESNYPEISAHTEVVEKLLDWKYGANYSASSTTGARLESLMSFFKAHEPYSFSEFTLLRELCLVGVLAGVPGSNYTEWNRERIFTLGCQLLGFDWKGMMKQLKGVVHPFFTMFCCLFDYRKHQVEHHEHIPFWRTMFPEIASWFLLSQSENGEQLGVPMIVSKLKDALNPAITDKAFPILYALSQFPERYTPVLRRLMEEHLDCKPNAMYSWRVRYLPQGAPTSPILANIVLQTFDEDIHQWSKDCGLSYSRYADDLTFSGKAIPQNLVQHVTSHLERHYYRINRHKTSNRGHGQHQEVNGLVINDGYVRVSSKYMKWLRAELHFLKISIQNNEKGVDDPALKKKYECLYGHLQYVKGVRIEQFEKLWPKFMGLSSQVSDLKASAAASADEAF